MVCNGLSLAYIEDETVWSVTPVSVENKAEELGFWSDSEGDDDSIKSNVTEVSKQGTNKKRKLAVASNVPRLIDNKRKSLEKRLPAAQRDQKLVEAAKEDTAMRKDMLECFRDSSRSTAQAMENMSTTLREMSQGMTQAMMSLANAFNRPQQHTQQQTTYHAPFSPYFNQQISNGGGNNVPDPNYGDPDNQNSFLRETDIDMSCLSWVVKSKEIV